MATAYAGGVEAADPLPQGDEGIAAQYEGDGGIADDPEVVLFDGFEGYVEATDLAQRWESVHHNEQITFVSAPEDVVTGEQALRLRIPQQDAELANGLTKWVTPELDALFVRYYAKFDAPYDVVGSSHNGSMISAHYYEGHQATPGVPADGTNKWLVNLENWRGEASTPSPGLLNLYVYHPEQRDNYGDHFFPTGVVMPNTSLPFDFGPDFVPLPDFVPELQRWYCYEFMVQANTPGIADGRIAAWIDGALVGDWTNIRLRDVPELTIDRFGIGFHIGSNPNGETFRWYDNVVAAHAYIGPIGGADSGEDGGGSGDDGGGTGAESGEDAAADDDPLPGDDGDDGGDADAGDSADDGDGSASTSDDGRGGSPPADGDGSCSCTAPASGPAAAWWWLLGLWVVGRRRGERHPSGKTSTSLRSRSMAPPGYPYDANESTPHTARPKGSVLTTVCCEV